MTDRPSARAVGGLALGLLLGVAGGWLAGMLRVPDPSSRTSPTDAPRPGGTTTR